MLSFNKTLRTGDTYTFSVSNAGKDKVRWHSSKSSVLTVDSKGKCKAVKHGTASVTAKVNCPGLRFRALPQLVGHHAAVQDRVLGEKRIPFDVSLDPFYSEENMMHLSRSIRNLESGNGSEHDIIED